MLDMMPSACARRRQRGRCDRGVMDRPTARAQLTDAVAHRESTREADDAARAQLEQAIREAHRAGLAQTEIVAVTGMHRNTVAKIVGDTPRA